MYNLYTNKIRFAVPFELQSQYCHCSPYTRAAGKKPFVVDYDDTLVAYKSKAKNQELIAWLKSLNQADHWLILCSARGDKRFDGQWTEQRVLLVAEELANELIAFGLLGLFDEVRIACKPYAEAYLDDRSVQVSTFVEPPAVPSFTADSHNEYCMNA